MVVPQRENKFYEIAVNTPNALTITIMIKHDGTTRGHPEVLDGD